MPDQKALVFVLMPFEDAFASVYTELIKKPLEALGFEVRRADSLLNQQNILKDVVKGIADATLVIADVTGLNENVLYELGMAHALGKRTIMITQVLDELPFDLRPYRANEYSMLFDRAHELADTLTDIGHAVLEDKADFSNPVLDFAPYALAGGAQVAQISGAYVVRVDSLDGTTMSLPGDEEAGPGFFELLVGMERGGERIQATADSIAHLTEEIGSAFSKHTEHMERVQKNLGERSAGALLAITRDAARDLDKFAEDMKPLATELQEALSESAAGANAIAIHSGVDSDDDVAQAEELIGSLREMETTMETTHEQVLEFAQSMLTMPHMDRRLTRSARNAGAVVSETADIIANALSEFTRSRGLLEERLDAYRRRSSA